MESFLLQGDNDIQAMRELMRRLPYGSSIVDFEEKMLLSSVRATTHLWRQDEKMIAFAFVDESNNLGYEIDPQFQTLQLEGEIVDRGVACIKKRNDDTGEQNTLDASCSINNNERIDFLERNGFIRQNIRTLIYERSLGVPMTEYALPEGFSIRGVNGTQEVEKLVALHRSAFGTQNMTVEHRLAIMHNPQYDPKLDLVAVAPGGELAAFCICGFTDSNLEMGYTDPIGVKASFKRQGLGKAVLATGLHELKKRGAKIVQLGTSSENLAMQRLAESLGFKIVSESLWFRKRTCPLLIV